MISPMERHTQPTVVASDAFSSRSRKPMVEFAPIVDRVEALRNISQPSCTGASVLEALGQAPLALLAYSLRCASLHSPSTSSRRRRLRDFLQLGVMLLYDIFPHAAALVDFPRRYCRT